MVMPSVAPAPKPSGAIKSKLMQLLGQAAQIAAQNGIDFNQLLQEFLQQGEQMPPPRPPMPG